VLLSKYLSTFAAALLYLAVHAGHSSRGFRTCLGNSQAVIRIAFVNRFCKAACQNLAFATALSVVVMPVGASKFASGVLGARTSPTVLLAGMTPYCSTSITSVTVACLSVSMQPGSSAVVLQQCMLHDVC